ncbi:MAG TPA: hypothetical protein VJA94_20250 [Candidatus Angelobacter sp.]
MSEGKHKNGITRRSFARGAAVAATAPFFPKTEIWAENAAPVQAQPGALQKLSPAARAEVEAKAKEILRKYGSRLSDEQKTDIRKVLAETQDGLEKMRRFALDNGDQPATVFKLTVEKRARAHAE